MKKRDLKSVNSINAVISDLHILKDPITVATANGDVTLAPGRDKVYFEFSLLHSYNGSAESINSNGATFLYSMLIRFYETAMYSPLDVEHEIEASPLFKGKNRIVGSIIHARFGDDDIANDTLFPEQSYPIKCIGVLWGRLADAKMIIGDVAEGKEWKVSMEIDRDPGRDIFVAGKEIITSDNEDWDKVVGLFMQNKKYNGETIGVALGGTGLEEEDRVNLFGTGMTMDAADDKADIHQWMIAPTATKNKTDFLAIAVKTDKKTIGENIMKKVEFKTDGTLKGSSLFINNKDQGTLVGVSIHGNDDWDDGDVGINWTKEVRDGDIVQNEHYEYDPETATVKKGEDNMGISLAEVEKRVNAVRQEYANHKTPDELETAVAEEKKKFDGFVSSEDAKTASDAAIEVALAERDAQDTAYADREDAITTAKLELTDERREAVRNFEVSSEGDKEFNDWLKGLSDGQAAIEKVLKDKKIKLTDDVKEKVASFNDEKDERFTAMVDGMVIASGKSAVSTPVDFSDEIDDDLQSKANSF